MKKPSKEKEPRKYNDLTAQEKFDESAENQQALYLTASEVKDLNYSIQKKLGQLYKKILDAYAPTK